MVENPHLSEENRNSFRAFSGTTLWNFLAGAFVNEGIVLFDKTRNPKHDFKEIYFAQNIQQTFRFCAQVADETRGTPVIMESKLPNNFRGASQLPVGFLLPVLTLWVPKPDLDHDEFFIDLYRGSQKAQESLVRTDPLEYLQERIK